MANTQLCDSWENPTEDNMFWALLFWALSFSKYRWGQEGSQSHGWAHFLFTSVSCKLLFKMSKLQSCCDHAKCFLEGRMGIFYSMLYFGLYVHRCISSTLNTRGRTTKRGRFEIELVLSLRADEGFSCWDTTSIFTFYINISSFQSVHKVPTSFWVVGSFIYSHILLLWNEYISHEVQKLPRQPQSRSLHAAHLYNIFTCYSRKKHQYKLERHSHLQRFITWLLKEVVCFWT